ncbi:MAG: hypothetical protein HY038_02170, partial [Nitrospirae bacterium]|nr:hypothetical protein [Nitrospirota bacterium]
LTLVWFLLVSIGSVTFVITYAMAGGFTSLRGTLIGAGIIGIALLVLAFGLMTVVISYRLENSRLTKVYDELCEALEGSPRSESHVATR